MKPKKPRRLEYDIGTGEVKYLRGTPQNEDEQQLYDAIKKKYITVNLETSSEAIMGKSWDTKLTLKLIGTITLNGLKFEHPVFESNVLVTQKLNPIMVYSDKDKYKHVRGTGFLHEITEGYQKALIAIEIGKSIGPAKVYRTVYEFNGKIMTIDTPSDDWYWFDIAHGRASQAPNEKKRKDKYI